MFLTGRPSAPSHTVRGRAMQRAETAPASNHWGSRPDAGTAVGMPYRRKPRQPGPQQTREMPRSGPNTIGKMSVWQSVLLCHRAARQRTQGARLLGVASQTLWLHTSHDREREEPCCARDCRVTGPEQALWVPAQPEMLRTDRS